MKTLHQLLSAIALLLLVAACQTNDGVEKTAANDTVPNITVGEGDTNLNFSDEAQVDSVRFDANFWWNVTPHYLVTPE